MYHFITHDVHGERDEPVILDEHGEEVHPVDDHTELLYQGLAVEEVVGGNEEIPGEGPEPGQVVHLVHCVSNVDNLRETL